MLAAGAFLTLGGMSGKYIFILCGLVLVGLAYGGCPTITSAYINKAFGPVNFPTNFSIANFSLIPAATIGPMISSALLEASGGSYNTNFYAIIGFSVAALIMCGIFCCVIVGCCAYRKPIGNVPVRLT